MGFQFIRIELFSRKGKDGRSTGFIFDEVSRLPSASLHVREPRAPIVVHGLGPDALRALHDCRAAEARTEVKGGKARAIRQDQNTLVTVILSHPATTEEYFAQPEIATAVHYWEARSIAWLRSQYGERLVSVIRHTDESHPHLHAYILPDDPAMTAAQLHPGFQAKAVAKAGGLRPEEDDKAVSKRADAAYKSAMRMWLDDYHLRVAQPCGLTRLGPGKRRLTRDQWQQEKRQADSLRDTLAKAERLKAQADAFVERVKKEAAAVRADATAKANSAKAAIVAAKAAEEVAREQTETARTAAKQAQRNTRAARRLMGISGLLRAIWDGLRKSKVAARVREELRPTIERWQQAEAAARAATAKESDRRQKAEQRVSALSISAAELGAQRDALRRRLDRYEPDDVAPVLPRPQP